KDDENEWNNPYFGFPQMIRFAFNPNKSSIRKMEQLKKDGVTFALSALFEPLSIKKDEKTNKHKKFKNEKEILDLLQIIDGSKNDENIIGFLDYDKIKKGNMCRHIVMVLPYCASCDAMEKLITNNKNLFTNLRNYEIINISGVEGASNFKKSSTIKRIISKLEAENKKTITLTVNRLLTGSTVKEWDTMLYFKDTASPQEYDQAIFRLQNQYTRTLYNGERIIKENMKPQTILVDFDPNRLFKMQEQKSLIYNVNTEKNGNTRLIERIAEELRISPIIMINHNKIRRVEATNILEAISEYNNQKSISDEVVEIPIDLRILKDENIKFEIERQSEFSSKNGFTLNPIEGDGEELEVENTNNKPNKEDKQNNSNSSNNSIPDKDNNKIYKQKIQTYYQRMLFYAFLCNTHVKSLDDIIKTINNKENLRLSKNLSLNKNILSKIANIMDPFIRSRLDYKIQNISNLAYDQKLTPIERALTSLKKFNRMSASEIITPVNIAKEMVDLISENSIRKIVANNMGFLDIASKSGEYALALYKRLVLDLGYPFEEVRKNIFSIPTSNVAYEFTSKFYEILNLDIKNIAVDFTTYDLLEINKNNNSRHNLISNILSHRKDFCKINLNETTNEGENKMKFGAIVGNPPYHEKAKGKSSSDDPIYNKFMDLSYEIANLSILITPARFLFNAGKTPSSWNKKMLKDKHFKIEKYEINSAEIFPTTSIPGGIVVSKRDSEQEFGNIGTFFMFPELKTIKEKVWNKTNQSITNIIYTQNKFNLDNLYADFPDYKNMIGSSGKDKRFRQIIMERLEVFSINEVPNSLRILGLINKKRAYRFIPEKYVEDTKWINCYKVFVPFSNGASGILGKDPARIISKPVLGYPKDGITQTFLGFGALNSEDEANALLKYIKSKFCRILLGILKVTQGNKSDTWKYVPLEDFSNNSDIDWTESIENIDYQLYKKYELNPNEIHFIENKIVYLKD
ncbi:MAG: Eco57I restriction-modification methylase domain-containing protein, partial [Bacilli bacterium]